MSISTDSGISMMLGQTVRPEDTSSCPYYCSAGPEYFTIVWNTEGALEIHQIKNSYEEMITEGVIVKSELFAIVHMNSIDSNITLTKIIDGSTVLQNSELNVYCSILGKTDLNNIRFGNKTFKANVDTMMRYWNYKIKYDLDLQYATSLSTSLSTTDLFDYVYKNLITILQNTYEAFNSINTDYSYFDLSAYINLISSCFSSFANVITSYIQDEDILILDRELNVDNKLKQIDSVFYTYYKTNEVLNQSINTMIEVIRKIFVNELMLIDEENNVTLNYCFFDKMLELNNKAKILMGNSYDPQEFNDYYLGKISAICNLAFIFELMYRIGENSTSSLYFLFGMPQKFSNI